MKSLWLKKRLRELSLRFEWWTNEWVLPKSVWQAIDENRYEDAATLLEGARDVWGTEDPEYVRAQALIGFMDDPLPEERWTYHYTLEVITTASRTLGAAPTPITGVFRSSSPIETLKNYACMINMLRKKHRVRDFIRVTSLSMIAHTKN